MDLIPNATFRILGSGRPNPVPGLYRVILSDIGLNITVAARIESEEEQPEDKGAESNKQSETARRKKPPLPLVGNLIWFQHRELQALCDAHLLKEIELSRVDPPQRSEASERSFKARVQQMALFLDLKKLQDSILTHHGVGDLVRMTAEQHGVTKHHVYRMWSLLCRHGLHPNSLLPSFHRCGGPNTGRPCDVDPDTSIPLRKKAGRKDTTQSTALKFGVRLESSQQPMNSSWLATIQAVDAQIPIPKPAWPKRCELIRNRGFCGQAIEEDGEVKYLLPPMGQYPNDSQIKRALTTDATRLELILNATTKRHFEASRRGLTAKAWEGSAGPGHMWAIDSTVGDIYLRSSINRQWIVGRPIVYTIVDIWSSAVVGFYVCLSGPSWSQAKISLFNASANHNFVSQLAGAHRGLGLQPAPTLCHALLADRGEYLSKGHRETAISILGRTSYTPPYRGDLKGSVEVMHRIAKDEQFHFIPGAIDYRRAELELRKVDPNKCVLTVREYTQYLYELFRTYNLTADRRKRLDAHMIGAGVQPCPAGLWGWAHDIGIAYRKKIADSDLITLLLPSATASICRDGVNLGGKQYMSEQVKEEQWTTYARNLGGWETKAFYHPITVGRIWVPQSSGDGLTELQIMDEARASAELTVDEWVDSIAIARMRQPSFEHERNRHKLESWRITQQILERAKRLNQEALEDGDGGSAPTMSEARKMEGEAQHSSKPAVAQDLLDEVDQAEMDHEEMVGMMFHSQSTNMSGIAHA